MVMARKVALEIEREIIRLYVEKGKSLRQIAQLLKINTMTVLHVLQRNNVDRRLPKRRLPEETEREIIHLYTEEGRSLREIARQFGIDVTTARAVLQRNNIKQRSCNEAIRQAMRHYNLDEKFFDAVDQPVKAYWLGFLCADGCVRMAETVLPSGRRGHAGIISVNLHINDQQHLEKLRKTLNSDSLVREYEINSRKFVQLQLNSVHLAEALIRLGCVLRKSLILQWPSALPEEFVSDFVRGFFDGDGCLCRNKSGGWHLTFYSGSPHFLQELAKKLHKYCGVSQRKPCQPKGVNCFYIRYSGAEDIKHILDWLYLNSTPEIRLDRKYEKYQVFLHWYKERQKRITGECA